MPNQQMYDPVKHCTFNDIDIVMTMYASELRKNETEKSDK